MPGATLCGMNNAEAATCLAPVIVLHISLISLESDANWREVNHRLARVVPPVSSVAGAIAIARFFVRPLRDPWLLIALVPIQMAVAGIAMARRRPADPPR